MGFKPDELGNQVIQLCFRFCRRHEEENIVEVALFGYNLAVPEVIGQNDGRNAEVFVFPGFHMNTRCHELQFHGVNEILALGVSLEGVPFAARFEGEVGNVFRHLFRIPFFPFLPMNHRRHNGTEVAAVAEHFFSGFNGIDNAFVPQHFPCIAFLHFSIHVQGSKNLVVRGGG